jgi:hypothetical protein
MADAAPQTTTQPRKISMAESFSKFLKKDRTRNDVDNLVFMAMSERTRLANLAKNHIKKQELNNKNIATAVLYLTDRKEPIVLTAESTTPGKLDRSNHSERIVLKALLKEAYKKLREHCPPEAETHDDEYIKIMMIGIKDKIKSIDLFTERAPCLGDGSVPNYGCGPFLDSFETIMPISVYYSFDSGNHEQTRTALNELFFGESSTTLKHVVQALEKKQTPAITEIDKDQLVHAIRKAECYGGAQVAYLPTTSDSPACAAAPPIIHAFKKAMTPASSDRTMSKDTEATTLPSQPPTKKDPDNHRNQP